jgi:N-acetylneuraminic acid mutarotase
LVLGVILRVEGEGRMTKASAKLFALIALAITLSACGREAGQPTPPGEISVTVAPNTANVHVSQSVLLQATVFNSLNDSGAVTWSLSGAGCSSTTCGTISSTGLDTVLYTAPASVPSPATVTVKATSVAHTSISASATITILAAVVVTDEWTWVSGGSTINQGPIYGTKGTAAPTNVPGARERAVSWIDSSGNLWLFGGYGGDSAGTTDLLNDLWKYDPTTLEWTWVSGSNTVYQAGTYGTKGVAAPSNVPGGRMGAVSWIDSQGKLWLFGGVGYASVGYNWRLNDLWKFDPTTLEWTWVSGSDIGNQAGTYGAKGTAAPANVPGARYSAESWIDSSGKLWLFGGWGYNSGSIGGELNDLWEYDPATLEWTWVSGSSSIDQTGIYGTQGTADPSNVPGGRHEAVSWIDPQGKLWLFGGWCYFPGSNGGKFNDLWEYDPATLEWTWASGSNVFGQNGTYGIQGTADSSNVPGARYMAVSWLDSQGNFWLFGGIGIDSGSGEGDLNDLWKYDPTTLEWTWVSGSSSVGQPGTYGIQGTADSSNVPGARYSAVSWLDSQGNLWLFGGTGIDSAGHTGRLNDLWQIR